MDAPLRQEGSAEDPAGAGAAARHAAALGRANARRTARERSHTKIVATIGPASEGRIEELIDAGMSVVRLNFSHGSAEEHRRRADIVRKTARAMRRPVALMADIQGPKLRMGRFADKSRELEVGDRLVVRQGDEIAEPGEVYFNFEGFLDRVEPGHRMLLADGAVELVAIDVARDHIVTEVVREGAISDRKGVNLPDSRISLRLPTEKDVDDITIARQIGVDMLALSFVGDAADVERIRDLAPDVQLVSKIERAIALEHIHEILQASDGVMVARGDLGVEVDLEQLPMIQKSVIHEAITAGRFVITATEMLESMIHSSRPTRAEVTDIANAVLDGTDAVMLSAETAIGKHPVEAVAVMNRICRAVEQSQRYLDLPKVSFRSSEQTFSNAIALAAVQAAEALHLTKIIAFTETGNTVRLVSRYRPSAEVIAITPSERVYNGMNMLAHVRPFICQRGSSIEEMWQTASDDLLASGLVSPGEKVIFVAGIPPGVARTTNLMKLHRIGEQLRFH
ncbi:MAG: pyruvate kinase [Planctomycetota bacterium]